MSEGAGGVAPQIRFGLAGKRVLVTGASSGIGREIALTCAAAGAQVLAVGRDPARLAEVVEAMVPVRVSESKHSFVSADLTDDAAIKSLADGAGPIDGLVHAAGISVLAPVRLVSREHLETQYRVNVVGPLLLTQRLLARNQLQRDGSILFISSISARIGTQGVASYSATKAALESAARCLALEVAKRRIRVNCLAPGLVKTPMFEAMQATTGGIEDTVARYPLGLGTPEDVANAAIFFLSDASRWITGTSLVMDGGHTID